MPNKKPYTMKRTALIILATLATISIVNAQRNTGAAGAYELPKHIIKTNFLPMLAGPIPFTNEYRLVYEQKTGLRSSVQISGAYLGKSPFFNLFEKYAIDSLGNGVRLGIGGGRVQLAYKFYLLKKQEAPKGFYIGPNLSVAFAKMKNKNNPEDYVTALYSNASLMAGYQFIIGDHFAFDLFTGLGVKYNHYGISADINNNNNSDFYFDRLNWVGPKFWLGFNLGYAFQLSQ